MKITAKDFDALLTKTRNETMRQHPDGKPCSGECEVCDAYMAIVSSSEIYTAIITALSHPSETAILGVFALVFMAGDRHGNERALRAMYQGE